MTDEIAAPSNTPSLAELGYSESQIAEIEKVCKAAAGMVVRYWNLASCECFQTA